MVSVIIPCLNVMKYIDVQLTALSEQNFGGVFEVLVSDNGSTDGLEQHIANHPLTAELDLRYIDSSQRAGISFARNNGSAHARGQFLAFCDGDDRVHSSWLTQLLLSAEFADLIAGGVESESINSPEVHSWRPFSSTDGLVLGRFLPSAMGCNIGIWKRAFDSIGGFDESMTAGEDVEFSWRAQISGLSFAHAPKATVAYRLRSTLSGTWHQTVSYGMAEVELFLAFRDYGVRRPTIKSSLTTLAGLILLNPLIPQRLSGMPRGRWIAFAGLQVGKLKCAARNRTFYF